MWLVILRTAVAEFIHSGKSPAGRSVHAREEGLRNAGRFVNSDALEVGKTVVGHFPGKREELATELDRRKHIEGGRNHSVEVFSVGVGRRKDGKNERKGS